MALMRDDLSEDQLDRRALMAQMGRQNAPGVRPQYGVSGSTDELIAGMTRRGGSAGGGALSGAAGGAGKGATIGSVIPGVGTGIGAGVGAVIGGIAGAFNKKAETAPTDFLKTDAERAVQSAYREYLGRDASPQEIATHLRNQGLKPGDSYVGEAGLSAVLNAIRGSDEAKAFAERGSSQPISNPQPSTNLGDTSQWDTDSYPKPQHIAQSFAATPPPGFDATNWNDPNMQTPKYVWGRIASNYDMTKPEGIQAAVAEFQKAYPTVKFDGKDRIWGIPGISGTVDIVAAMGSDRAMPWWNDESGGPPPDQMTAPGGPSAFARIQSLVPTDADFFNTLQNRLAHILGGESALSREALLRLLGA